MGFIRVRNVTRFVKKHKLRYHESTSHKTPASASVVSGIRRRYPFKKFGPRWRIVSFVHTIVHETWVTELLSCRKSVLLLKMLQFWRFEIFFSFKVNHFNFTNIFTIFHCAKFRFYYV